MAPKHHNHHADSRLRKPREVHRGDSLDDENECDENEMDELIEDDSDHEDQNKGDDDISTARIEELLNVVHNPRHTHYCTMCGKTLQSNHFKEHVVNNHLDEGVAYDPKEHLKVFKKRKEATPEQFKAMQLLLGRRKKLMTKRGVQEAVAALEEFLEKMGGAVEKSIGTLGKQLAEQLTKVIDDRFKEHKSEIKELNSEIMQNLGELHAGCVLQKRRRKSDTSEGDEWITQYPSSKRGRASDRAEATTKAQASAENELTQIFQIDVEKITIDGSV